MEMEDAIAVMEALEAQQHVDSSAIEREQEFERATEFMKTVAGNMEKDKLLYFYARYKQATVGKCNIPRPGMFNPQGKRKWDAWNALDNMTKEQAMTEYIRAMEAVDPDWTEKVKDQRSSVGGLGLGVSTMMGDAEEELSDNQKSIYDWCKEGSVDQVRRLLSCHGVDINQQDDEGLTLLHWACDRGHVDIVRLLLENQAKIDVVDVDDQTPLHYACTCEHIPVVEILVQNGADVDAQDNEGSRPVDNTFKKEIHNLLAKTSSVVR